jgi:DNA-binding GntR family transcriptional regulator
VARRRRGRAGRDHRQRPGRYAPGRQALVEAAVIAGGLLTTVLYSAVSRRKLGRVSEPARRPDGGAIGESQQLSHKVADYVRERIMTGQLPDGQFLRTESLAAELKVSATPVREALMSLQSEGTVHWEPRRGFRVVNVSEQDVRDLFQVQAYIAGELAARAAAELDADTLDELRQLQAQLEEAAKKGDLTTADAINDEIHRRINKASDSHRLATLLKQTVQYLPLKYFGTVAGWAQAAAHDHSVILQALSAGDAELARAAMASHVRHIGELLIAHLHSRLPHPAN